MLGKSSDFVTKFKTILLSLLVVHLKYIIYTVHEIRVHYWQKIQKFSSSQNYFSEVHANNMLDHLKRLNWTSSHLRKLYFPIQWFSLKLTEYVVYKYVCNMCAILYTVNIYIVVAYYLKFAFSDTA